MADTGYKFYQDVGSGQYQVIPYAGNTPSGFREVTVDEYKSGLTNLLNQSKAGQTIYKNPQTWTEWEKQLADADSYLTKSSGYEMVNGVPWSTTALQQQQQQQADIASGAAINIGTASAPLTVPTGSSGATLTQGIQSGAVSPTNPQQQLQAIGQPAPTPVQQTAVGGVIQPVQGQPVQGQAVQGAMVQQPVQQQIAGLTPQQIQGLDAAAARVTQGTANATDLKNLEYAKAKFGYNYQSPTQNASQGQTGATGGVQEVQPTAGQIQTDGETTNTLSQYGVTPQTSITDPIKYAQDVYNQVYGNLGLSAAKKQVEDINRQLLDLRNEKFGKIADINEDPWLVEGVRVARVGKMEERYQQKESNLLAYLAISQGLYDSGVQQAQNISNQAIGIYQDQVNFQQQVQLQNIETESKLADARFQIANGQPFYKYEGSATVYDTKTGKPLTYNQYINMGGPADFSSTYEISSSDTQAEKTQVLNLMSKYPDAGIQPSDDLNTASSKLRSSRIYQDQVRGPVGSGGGAGVTTPTTGLVDANGKPIKLSAAQVDTLSGFDTTVSAANSALQLLETGVQTGPIAGNMLQFQKFLGEDYSGKIDENQLKLEQLMSKIRADFMKAISGAAVSESEVQRLSAFLPSITDQEGVIKSKLGTLIDETNRAKQNLISTLGGTQQYSPTTPAENQQLFNVQVPSGFLDLSQFEY